MPSFINYLILFESFVIACLIGFDVKFILCFGMDCDDLLTTIISVVCMVPIPVLAIYFMPTRNDRKR